MNDHFLEVTLRLYVSSDHTLDDDELNILNEYIMDCFPPVYRIDRLDVEHKTHSAWDGEE